MSTPTPPHDTPSRAPISAARIAFSLVAVLGGLAALLFVPAGRLDWPGAWALLAAYGVFLALYAAWGLRKDPDQLRERGQARKAESVKPWDKAIMAACLHRPPAADPRRGRLGRRTLPLAGRAAAGEAGGLAGVGRGGCADLLGAHDQHLPVPHGAHAFGEDDRGQVVVTAGPYRCMRHPMYLGVILLFLGMPVALGSWWALLPGAATGLPFVLRTAKEDRMLRDELSGYVEYTEHVR